MRKLFTVETHAREVLVDITKEVRSIVESSGIHSGIVSLYVQGATAALMIQENWDVSVKTDVVHLLQKLIPQGVWLHDRHDGNGDSHLKADALREGDLKHPSEDRLAVGGVSR